MRSAEGIRGVWDRKSHSFTTGPTVGSNAPLDRRQISRFCSRKVYRVSETGTASPGRMSRQSLESSESGSNMLRVRSSPWASSSHCSSSCSPSSGISAAMRQRVSYAKNARVCSITVFLSGSCLYWKTPSLRISSRTTLAIRR